MAWLLRLLGFFTGLGTLAVKIVAITFTAKVAIRFAVVGIIIGLFLLALTGISGLISGLSYVVPSQIEQMWSFVIPANFVPCVSAVISVQVFIWVWEWKKYAIELTAFGA